MLLILNSINLSMNFMANHMMKKKQVIVQKVREAERAQVIDAYQDRVGEMVSGVVKRSERSGVIMDLGNNAEAFIPREDLIPREAVRPGDRIRAYLKEVKPAKPLTGVLEPVNVLHFDYLLWTHKDASNETVYKVVKTMYENEKDLRSSSPLWRSHSSKRMSKDQGFEIHPGAMKFYKEVGAR